MGTPPQAGRASEPDAAPGKMVFKLGYGPASILGPPFLCVYQHPKTGLPAFPILLGLRENRNRKKDFFVKRLWIIGRKFLCLKQRKTGGDPWRKRAKQRD